MTIITGAFILHRAVKISVIDDIFAALFFERIRVPDYAHGTPETAIQDITESLEQAKSSFRIVKPN